VAVASVTVAAGDVPLDEALRRAGTAGLVGLTPERVAQEYTRRLGKGAVIFLPMGDLPLERLASAVLTRPELFLPGARAPYPALEGDTANVFLTRFRDGRILLLNFSDAAKQVRHAGEAITLPARGIAEGAVKAR
jgi:hypothetical protein